MWNRAAEAPDERDGYRYERKFVTPNLTREQVELLIKLHPALFREIHHERCVNNIYLDTWSLQSFQANAEGLPDRTKVRIRWYGEMLGAIPQPVLELKHKRGLLGTKDAYPLPPFTLEESFQARELFEKAELPEGLMLYLATLQPALLNRYLRRYYLSADGRYRITVDSELEFFRIHRSHNAFLERTPQRPTLVIELKFARRDDRDAQRISNAFPFRLTKSSKYVTGLDGLFPW